MFISAKGGIGESIYFPLRYGLPRFVQAVPNSSNSQGVA